MVNLHHCTFTKYFLELKWTEDLIFSASFSSLNIVENVCCPKVDYVNSEEKFLNKFTITVSAENNVIFFMLCRSLSSFASHEEAELTEEQVMHSGQTIIFLVCKHPGKHCFSPLIMLEEPTWSCIKSCCYSNWLTNWAGKTILEGKVRIQFSFIPSTHSKAGKVKKRMIKIIIDEQVRELSQITFAFFGIFWPLT